jgi:hypothetical protein
MVKCILDVSQNAYDRPEQEKNAHPSNHPSFGIFKKGSGKGHDPHRHLLLALKYFKKLFLKGVLKAKTMRYAKGHGQQRDNGKEGIKGEGRGPEETMILVESSDGQDYDP